MEKAKAIQDQLDDLQQEMHAKVEACDLKHNKEKNSVFAARRATIADLIAKKELPSNFWAAALINLLQAKDRESTSMPHFLGPYDEMLLNTYLEGVEVEYTQQGHKVVFRFRPNPFFEETELWAAATDMIDDEEMDEEDDMPPAEEIWDFSGVTWKDGHGPQMDEEEEEEDEEDDGEGAPGQKRPHAGSSSGNNGAAASATQGPSVLEVFTEMPPHPEEDEEMEEDDDSAIEDSIREWEAEMDDRKMLLRLVEHFVHLNPVASLQEAATADEDGESAAKKPKAE